MSEPSSKLKHEQDSAGKNDQADLRNNSKKIPFPDRIMVLASVIAALATAIYAFSAIMQLKVMSKTLQEMHDSGLTSSAQTHSIITEANRIADSMKDTVEQSRNTVLAAIENFRLEQRAWIGPTQAVPPEYIEGKKKVFVKEGQPVKSGVIITNNGKTPARKLRVRVSMATLKSGEKLVPGYNVDMTTLPHSNYVMQPGAQLLIPASLKKLTDMNFSDYSQPSAKVEERIASKTDIENFMNGQSILYMYGFIRYEDIFGRAHQTKFCMFLEPELIRFRGCDTYNEAD